MSDCTERVALAAKFGNKERTKSCTAVRCSVDPYRMSQPWFYSATAALTRLAIDNDSIEQLARDGGAILATETRAIFKIASGCPRLRQRGLSILET